MKIKTQDYNEVTVVELQGELDGEVSTSVAQYNYRYCCCGQNRNRSAHERCRIY